MKHSASQELPLYKNSFFINKLSSKFIISSVLSMVFLYAGSLIDTIIVGAYLSEAGLSAMSLVSPVYLIYYTVGATIGIGASLAAGRVLSEVSPIPYKQLFTAAAVLMSGAVVLMTLGGYLFLEPISIALSGGTVTEETQYVRDYLKYYIPGGGLNLLAYIPLYFLKVEGRPKVSSRLFSLSAIINVILSWLFMSPVCNMGIGGASLATTISMLVTAVLGFACLLIGHSSIGFVRGSLTMVNIRNIIVSGVPNGLSNLLESARILMINMLLISIGQAVLLPCYTVVRNVSDLMNAIMIGISSALLPLIGVFFSERDYDSEREVMRLSRRIGVLVMIPLTVLVCVFPGIFFRLFGVSDPMILAAGRIALPVIGIGLIAGYLNTMYTGYLTAIQREGFATLMVALRLIGVLAAFAFPMAKLWGAVGIWISLSAAEIGTCAVFCLIRLGIMRKNRTLDRFLLNRTGSVGDVSFSVKNDVGDITFASEQIAAFCENADIDRKLSMRVSLAIEEILTFLLSHCLQADQESFVDVRVCKITEGVMVRFRYVGVIFDPITFYRDNMENEEMQDELLGLQLITKAAQSTTFRQTLGANNLMILF